MRRLDGRRRSACLGKGDWLLTWAKPARPSPWLALAQWAGLPATLPLRVVRGRVGGKGCRVRQVTVVTILLDPALYPSEEILQALPAALAAGAVPGRLEDHAPPAHAARGARRPPCGRKRGRA